MSRSRLAALSPPARLVDWGILVLVAAEAATGVLSLGAGAPAHRPLFVAHSILGLSLLALVALKLRRVWPRVRDRSRWDRATPTSILLAAVAVAALLTGVAWVLGGDVRVGFWTLMNVHVGLGLLLLPLVLVHLRARFRPPRRADFRGRRTALRFTGLLVGSAVLWRLQSVANALLDTAGASLRFTGSRPVGALAGRDADTVGGDFPVTSWVADDPAPVDRGAWRLDVGGLVAESLTLDYGALVGEGGGAEAADSSGDAAAATEDGGRVTLGADLDRAGRRALLDCTSGWYTIQDWEGVHLGDLLDAAGVASDARFVRVRSVTGYRWSFPIGEARGFLLATHVGGEALSHGHGAPLRLVAPDRRGFQWVKWVTAIEVRQRVDPGQYVATLVSGFDGDGRG
mgnify:CR=1 FL=1